MNGRLKKVPEKALPLGTMIHGKLSDYLITDYQAQDGFGILYRATGTRMPHNGVNVNETKFMIREFFMCRCSSRGSDGCEMVTPEDVLPTVDNFKKAFLLASQNCAAVSEGCPNIINVIEIIEEYGTIYYVVEYLEGETLEDYVNKEGPMSVYEMRKLLAPIFYAVEHMHLSRTMHTDIYPRHIRFVESGGKKIPVLFSLYASKCFDDNGLPIWLSPVVVCRTGYAPPEQYRNIEHFLPQSDIYALAALIVFVLSGKNLPDSRTLKEKDVRDALPPMLPETMIGTLLHGLCPDYTGRPATVTLFMEELIDFYDANAKYVPLDERRHVLHTVVDDNVPQSAWSRIKRAILRIFARLFHLR